MSRQPTPTVEELRWVYEMILSGFNNTDMKNEYLSLQRMEQLQFPVREDDRFFNARRKELQATREVLEADFRRRVDPVIVESKQRHFVELRDIASTLLGNGLSNVVPMQNTESQATEYVVRTDEIGDVFTLERLKQQVEDNLNIAYSSRGHRYINDCFVPHWKAECQEIETKGISRAIRDNPYEVVRALQLMSDRGTFQGICPVCEAWQ